MEDLLRFKDEVKNMETADILLILQDQLELYSEDEKEILKIEFSKRSDTDIESSQKHIIHRYKEEFERHEQENELKRLEQLKIIKNNKIKALAQSGYDSYYEYTSLVIKDDCTGSFNINDAMLQINELALSGWRLKATITNELGKNTAQFGVGVFSSGTNATIEQTIFIFERKIKISE